MKRYEKCIFSAIEPHLCSLIKHSHPTFRSNFLTSLYSLDILESVYTQLTLGQNYLRGSRRARSYPPFHLSDITLNPTHLCSFIKHSHPTFRSNFFTSLYSSDILESVYIHLILGQNYLRGSTGATSYPPSHLSDITSNPSLQPYKT